LRLKLSHRMIFNVIWLKAYRNQYKPLRKLGKRQAKKKSRQNVYKIGILWLFFSALFFTPQHSIGYQSFEASRKMTRHQQSFTRHGFDTTSN
jgi:hypothetical protein